MLALGLTLRLLHWPWRWNYWYLDLLSYTARVQDALVSGRPGEAALLFVGQHPPLHGLVHATWDAAALPGWAHGASGLLGEALALALLAGALQGRVSRATGLVAAGFLACSGFRVQYGLDPGPYPWAAACFAALAGSAWAPVAGRRRDVLLPAGAAAVAVWTDLAATLAAVALCGLHLWGWLAARRRLDLPGAALPGRRALGLALGVGTGIPLLPQWWALWAAPSTWHNPSGGALQALGATLVDRVGGLAVAVLATALLAVGWGTAWVRCREVALGAVALGGIPALALAVAMGTGAAAPFQASCWLGPGVVAAGLAAVGVAQASGRWRLPVWTLALCWLALQADRFASMLPIEGAPPGGGAGARAWSPTDPRPLVVLWDTPFPDDPPRSHDPAWRHIPLTWLGRRCRADLDRLRPGYCWQAPSGTPFLAWNDAGLPSGEEWERVVYALRTFRPRGELRLAWMSGPDPGRADTVERALKDADIPVRPVASGPAWRMWGVAAGFGGGP